MSAASMAREEIFQNQSSQYAAGPPNYFVLFERLGALAIFVAGGRSRWIAGFFLLVLAPGGCAPMDAAILGQAHRDYSEAITDIQKEQMLLNVVRLRYGDVPSFLSVDQVIASHSLGTTLTAGGTAYVPLPPPVFGLANNITLGGTVTYTDRPTFTFTPVTGKQLVGSFLLPLVPTEIFALAQNGVPIHVLLRLCVESLGRIDNTITLEGSSRTGSSDFLKLIDALQALQKAGSLSFRFVAGKDVNQVYLSIQDGNEPASRQLAIEARTLLGIGKGEARIVYGRVAGPGEIAMLTRSILGVLTQISMQIEVPTEDMRGRAGVLVVGERKPLILVHATSDKPEDAYAAVRYRGHWFWVADSDFDSKVAFSLGHVLLTISETATGNSRAPVVTIPAQ
jgi:hypothetical protein